MSIVKAESEIEPEDSPEDSPEDANLTLQDAQRVEGVVDIKASPRCKATCRVDGNVSRCAKLAGHTSVDGDKTHWFWWEGLWGSSS